LGATAVISAYSCRINNYNVSSGDKLVKAIQTRKQQIIQKITLDHNVQKNY